MPPQKLIYPFSAIVGQERLKLALILNAINPRIGGLLISGAKGTGKSLAVRALAEILPEVETVEGCPFNCSPHFLVEMCPTCHARLQAEGHLPSKKKSISIIQLPLSTTEDRLIGALDIEAAMKEGRKILEPGLLAEANQNILFIDEVNLLPDYLVNCFLDPAASGWNVVQREGLSLSHPSHFTLIASMNPEEGALRPQILDRFALHVKTELIKDVKQRIEVIRRNIAFEEDPVSFYDKFEKMQEELRERILTARRLLPKVEVSDQVLEGIARASSEMAVDGCRADIAAVKAAGALAAFRGRTVVEREDIFTVSELVLSHRRRERVHTEPSDTHEIIEEGLPSTETLTPSADKNGLLKPPTYTRKRRRRKRESSVFKVIVLPLIFMLSFVTYLAAIKMGVYLYCSVTGLPPERLAWTSLSHLWPYITLMALATLLLPFILSYLSVGRKRQIVPVYLYRAYGGKIGRRIMRQIRQLSTSSVNALGFEKENEEQTPSPTKILNIPLYASFSRLYRMILDRGPKIAESLKQFRERGKKYKFSLVHRVSRRRGSLVGKRVKTITSSRYGRYICCQFPRKKPWDIALAPTIRAAAPYQPQRKDEKLLVSIQPQDIRVKMREARTPLTIVLLLDMSESMTASLDNIRNAVLSMYDIAFKKRDRVALVIFKGSGATVLQPPTTNLKLLEKKLLEVGASDLTPLAAGMFQAWRILRNEKIRNREVVSTLIIISDGIANIPLKRPLTPFARSKFWNEAQADVVDVAGLLQREGIQTIVINTAHDVKWEEYISEYAEAIAAKTKRLWIDPTNLLLEIPRITGGYYYGIGEGGEIASTILMDAFTIADRAQQSIRPV